MDEKLYVKALQFLKLRPRSEKEVRDNLLKKKAPENQIDTIIGVLKEQKFLNDYDFAKWWIEQRTTFRPKGWYVIEQELKLKGISHEIIKSFAQEKSEDADLESAKRLIERQLRKYQGLSRQELYNKLGGYLSRRGFNYEVIKACIDSVLGK